jgi:serine/threonine protein kinase
LPARDQFEGRALRTLKLGGPTKADLHVVDIGDGPLVIKDFAHKAWWVRWTGRLQISRECRAYARLGSMPGVPRLVGRVDAHALALELIEGEELAFSPRRLEHGVEFLEQLRRIVSSMHARGLAHLDLRNRENVMLDASGRVCIVDLASAIWFRPGGLAHRLFFGWFKFTDDSAILKWKDRLRAGEYTEREREFLRRFSILRMLWIFNRKPSSAKGRD